MSNSRIKDVLVFVVAIALGVVVGAFIGGNSRPAPAPVPAVGIRNVGESNFDNVRTDGYLKFTSNPAQIKSVGGGGLQVLNALSTPVFVLDNAGGMTVTQNITVGGAYVGITPVATATAVNTPTPYTSYLGYASGYSIFCATTTITNTASYTASTTGLATSLVGGWAVLNQAVGGDARTANTITSGTTITVAVSNSALTPAANSTGASVFWCAVGH